MGERFRSERTSVLVGCLAHQEGQMTDGVCDHRRHARTDRVRLAWEDLWETVKGKLVRVSDVREQQVPAQHHRREEASVTLEQGLERQAE